MNRRKFNTNSNNNLRAFSKQNRGRGGRGRGVRGRGQSRGRGRGTGRGRGQTRGTKRNFSALNSSNSNINVPNKRQRTNNFSSNISNKINSHLNSNIGSRKIITKPSQQRTITSSSSNLTFTITNNNNPKPNKNIRSITAIPLSQPRIKQVKQPNKVITLNKNIPPPKKPAIFFNKLVSAKLKPEPLKRNKIINLSNIDDDDDDDDDNENDEDEDIDIETSQSPTNSEDSNEQKIKSLREQLVNKYGPLQNKLTNKKKLNKSNEQKIINKKIVSNVKKSSLSNININKNINNNIKTKDAKSILNRKLLKSKVVNNKNTTLLTNKKSTLKSKLTSKQAIKSKPIIKPTPKPKPKPKPTVKSTVKPTSKPKPKPKQPIKKKSGLSLSKTDILKVLKQRLKDNNLDHEYNENDEKFIEEQILKYKSNKEYHLSQENWQFWTKLLAEEENFANIGVYKRATNLQNLWKDFKEEVDSMITNYDDELELSLRELEIDLELL